MPHHFRSGNFDKVLAEVDLDVALPSVPMLADARRVFFDTMSALQGEFNTAAADIGAREEELKEALDHMSNGTQTGV